MWTWFEWVFAPTNQCCQVSQINSKPNGFAWTSTELFSKSVAILFQTNTHGTWFGLGHAEAEAICVRTSMAKGQNPVPLNIPIPTKIGSKMGGAPTPIWEPIGFDPQPYSLQQTSWRHSGILRVPACLCLTSLCLGLRALYTLTKGHLVESNQNQTTDGFSEAASVLTSPAITGPTKNLKAKNLGNRMAGLAKAGDAKAQALGHEASQ